MKATEGWVAALSELRRSLRRDPDGDAGSHLDRQLRTWRSDLHQKQDHDAAGAWTAYLQGGVDALEAGVQYVKAACTTEPKQD
jgi:hypothetical protein